MVADILLTILAILIESNSEEFKGEVMYTGGTELITEVFTLYDANGNRLYSIPKPPAITFFISDSGVVFATSEKEIYYYDKSGNIKKIKALDFPNGFAFTSDNSLFFASDRAGIYAFSMTGELTYQLAPGRLFCSTEKGEKICIVSNDTLYLYENGKQKSIRVMPTPYIHNIYFTQDQGKVIVEMLQGNEIIYFNNENNLRER